MEATSQVKMPESDSSDPPVHAANIRAMLTDLAGHARRDVAKVDDPRARALFETTAEVLGGLERAFEHFEDQSEEAWK
jgi:hypothetical protein